MTLKLVWKTKPVSGVTPWNQVSRKTSCYRFEYAISEFVSLWKNSLQMRYVERITPLIVGLFWCNREQVYLDQTIDKIIPPENVLNFIHDIYVYLSNWFDFIVTSSNTTVACLTAWSFKFSPTLDHFESAQEHIFKGDNSDLLIWRNLKLTYWLWRLQTVIRVWEGHIFC